MSRITPAHFTPVLVAAFLVLSATGATPATETSRTQAMLERYWGAMLEGGEWRTPNPGFSDPETTPREFALRWRWGPHHQHIQGDLLGIFDREDGDAEVLYWTLYLMHNPVTDEVTALQVGWDGSIATGPVSLTADGHVVLNQLLYNADGTVKAIRHQEIMEEDGNRYRSNVFERGDGGDWVLKREWTWVRKE